MNLFPLRKSHAILLSICLSILSATCSKTTNADTPLANSFSSGNDQASIVVPDIRIESVKSFTTEQENKIVLAAGDTMLPMLEDSSIVIQGTVTQRIRRGEMTCMEMLKFILT